MKPGGNVVDAIDRGPATVRVKAFCAVLELPSVRFTEKLKVPEEAGVPPISPALVKVRPLGREPEVTIHW